jgi:hypothetical protein
MLTGAVSFFDLDLCQVDKQTCIDNRHLTNNCNPDQQEKQHPFRGLIGENTQSHHTTAHPKHKPEKDQDSGKNYAIGGNASDQKFEFGFQGYLGFPPKVLRNLS